MKRLAIITTHPIQYNAPLFRLIRERGKINLKVFYTWSQALEKFEDPDFGQTVQWDIPLLEGYEWEAVNNVAKKPSSRSFFGVDNPDLIQKIIAFKPDAILVFGWNHNSHLKVMRHFKGKIPVWFRGDSTLLDYDNKSLKDLRASSFQLPAIKSYLKFQLRTLFLRWIYSYIDKAFYVGTHNKAYYLHHGLKEEQLIYAPHAVDNERFFDNEERQYEKKAKQWRHELGIPDEAKVILFAGKFEPKKNPGILIDAVIHLNEESNKEHFIAQNKGESGHSFQLPASSFHLILVGSGILESQLWQKAKERNYIHFLPFQNQSFMPVVYRLGDIFCLPSKGPGETWGLVINEAMAAGRPVIASDKCGGAIDLLNEKFIFDNNNIEQLISILQHDLFYDGTNIQLHSLSKVAIAFEKIL